jgi:hypothetical protein
LGLIQVFENLDVYDPDKPDFSFVRIIDLAGNPLHYTWDRSTRGGNSDFVADIINGNVSRDLNNYRGVTPQNKYIAEGLFAPNWGHTFKFAKAGNSSYQGIYVGAGPYVGLGTDLNFDPQLINILASAERVTIPKATFNITNITSEQVALAVTGGYRAKVSSGGKAGKQQSERNGVYVTANFHYLRGYRYDAIDSALRIDTGADGLILLQPSTDPVVIDQMTSTSGSGFALDFGIAAVMENWELGFSVEGVGNRIKWTNPKHRVLTLTTFLSDVDLIRTELPVSFNTIEAKLPVRYIGAIGYHWKSWSAMTDLAYGFENFSQHSGVECRISRLAFRGGARYSRERWNPSGGIGIDLSKRISVDIAGFAHTANFEKVREPSMAVSLRINPATGLR